MNGKWPKPWWQEKKMLSSQNDVVPKQALNLREKEEVKKKFNYTCVYCGCTNKIVLTVDHKIPLIRGGLNEYANLECACVLCNQLKGNMTDIEFKKYLKAINTLASLKKMYVKVENVQISFKPGDIPKL